MVRRTMRIQQAAVGIIAVLSLFVASVAACTCSHHKPITEAKASCHEIQHHDDGKSQNFGSPSIGETCFCVTPANDLSVKSESFKLKKLPDMAAAAPAPESIAYQSVTVDAAVATATLRHGRLVYPSVLSRGPPLL